MVGQKVEMFGLKGTIKSVEWVERWDGSISPGFERGVPSWGYRTFLRDPPWPEDCLKPHTMTLDDVPPDVLLAICTGKPVRVVDVPVGENGMPYPHGEYLGQEHSMLGQLIEPAGFDVGLAIVAGSNGESVFAWNLTLAEATPDA